MLILFYNISMKKITFILPLLLTALYSIGAAAPPVHSVKHVTTNLIKRCNRGYAQLSALENAYPRAMLENTCGLSFAQPFTLDLPTQTLYPDMKDYLTNPFQRGLYFIAKNNREVAKWLPKYDQYRKEIVENMEAFRQAKGTYIPSPEEDIKFITDRVTNDTQYLLVGETHGYSDLQNFVKQLVHEVRLKMPQREIVLFTEFLSEDIEDPFQEMLGHWMAPHLKIWKQAKADNIAVKGIEPQFVRAQSSKTIRHTVLYKETTLSNRVDIWSIPEGLRLRNNYWLSRLEAFRQAHPDALIILHAGTGHLGYNEPLSVGRSLKGPNTLLVTLYPSPTEEVPADEEEEEAYTSLFDDLTNNTFNDRVLYFNDPHLSHLAGFDIQVKVPLKHPYLFKYYD